MARFFAAGHGEFAASVPGGYTDIFREKKWGDFFSVCLFSSFIYTLFYVFSPIPFSYLSFFPILV